MQRVQIIRAGAGFAEFDIMNFEDNAETPRHRNRHVRCIYRRGRIKRRHFHEMAGKKGGLVTVPRGVHQRVARLDIGKYDDLFHGIPKKRNRRGVWKLARKDRALIDANFPAIRFLRVCAQDNNVLHVSPIGHRDLSGSGNAGFGQNLQFDTEEVRRGTVRPHVNPFGF
jgi:hypothetical protein